MKTEQAIKYFEDEIRFCERAPALNDCQMTGDWIIIRDASKAAVEALREKQERENPKPLTLEEMRSMIGEPVWVKVNDVGKIRGGGYWTIVSKAVIGLFDAFTAYRHKPEEVQP